jgi:hypothetical protein
MKRLLVVLSLLLTLVLPVTVYAAYNPLANACNNTGGAGGSTACTSDGSDPISGKKGVLRKVSFILATLGALIAVIIIIVGGFNYVTSGGDSNKTATARSAIVGAIVGLVIIALAETIVIFVIGKIAKG